MRIKNLKINGFGKLKDKEIELENGINVIYGKNEAGKSTLLKYITSMFYGLSKNKNGGTIPEVEKYEPWNFEEFSGKISYELDNSEIFEIYRDFKKKNPKIFNGKLEDISKEFNIDKTKGNEFFYEQTGLEEEIFTSSIITKQAEVKLDEKTQNSLIQKISNILGTGEDSTSYTTIVNKLKKKLNDEVGTANTKERPINVVENRIEELKEQKNELEKYPNYKFDIDEKINQTSEEIEVLNKELDNLRKANLEKEKLKENENRIKINKEMINSFETDIQKLLKNKEEISKEKSTKIISKSKGIIFLILATIVTLIEILVSNVVIKACSAAVLVIYIIYLLVIYNKKKLQQKDIKTKQKEINEQIKILEQNKAKQNVELDKIEVEYNEALNKIEDETKIKDLEDILELIDSKQRKINEQNY